MAKKADTSNPAIEGADMATTTTCGSTNGELTLDELVTLTLEQAISLRTLFQAKKERLNIAVGLFEFIQEDHGVGLVS